MRSRLYRGSTSHARTTPTKNSFRYPVYFLGVDLSELDELGVSLRYFSHNRANVVSLWDRDHGARDGSPLRPWIDALCARADIDITGGCVMLLTFPRVLGARFYPVSFWYCYGADDRVRAVLAEVHNTYRDHHNYLLHDGGEPFDFSAVHAATKAFYVSPFMPTENVRYEFTLTEPGETVHVSIRDILAGEGVLTAAIDLTAFELTDAAFRASVLTNGPISIVALVHVHRQALRLALKRTPFYAHTPPPEEDVTL